MKRSHFKNLQAGALLRIRPDTDERFFSEMAWAYAMGDFDATLAAGTCMVVTQIHEAKRQFSVEVQFSNFRGKIGHGSIRMDSGGLIDMLELLE